MISQSLWPGSSRIIRMGALAVLLITLGLGQLASAYWNLSGLSLVGSYRLVGYGLGVFLIAAGGYILPDHWSVLWWSLPAGLAALALLLGGGTITAPPPHPDDQLVASKCKSQTGCCAVQIPDGDKKIPGILLWTAPQAGERGPAVCIVPGAGDTKISFKWRLIETLLAEGLTVLTIDPPGHGEYRHRPLSYPDCLSVVPAALNFLRSQPNISQIGLIGISLGGALSLRSLAQTSKNNGCKQRPAALVVVATPTHLDYSRALFYREIWNTFYGAPSLSLFKEMSAGQARQTWKNGGYRSRYNTAELFELLNPLEGIKHFKHTPTLLVYSRRDTVATSKMAEAMRQAAPWAAFVESKKASHVMLTLIPEINRQIGRWLKAQMMRDE